MRSTAGPAALPSTASRTVRLQPKQPLLSSRRVSATKGAPSPRPSPCTPTVKTRRRFLPCRLAGRRVDRPALDARVARLWLHVRPRRLAHRPPVQRNAQKRSSRPTPPPLPLSCGGLKQTRGCVLRVLRLLERISPPPNPFDAAAYGAIESGDREALLKLARQFW